VKLNSTAHASALSTEKGAEKFALTKYTSSMSFIVRGNLPPWRAQVARRTDCSDRVQLRHAQHAQSGDDGHHPKSNQTWTGMPRVQPSMAREPLRGLRLLVRSRAS